MFRYLISVAAVALSVGSAQADALHLNPAQPSQSKNMVTFGPTSIPIGAYDYCQRYRDRCRQPTKAGRIKLTRGLWTSIVRVNDKVNRAVRPLTDLEIFGVKEKWTLPTNVGDCEDYALEKRRILKSAGIPLGAMLMTVGFDADGGGHAVLTVVTDHGDFILDNVEKRVLRWQEAELTYTKRQSPFDLRKWESLRPS